MTGDSMYPTELSHIDSISSGCGGVSSLLSVVYTGVRPQ